MSSRQQKRNALDGIVYDASRRDFWMLLENGDWLPLGEASIRRHLKARGISPKPKEGEIMSSIERALNKIQCEQSVAYAGSLAGFRRGVFTVEGRRILVTSSPDLAEPRPGLWPTIDQVLRILVTPECDQREYFYGWLKCALEGLRAGVLRPGQALAMAGPRDCGKSLLQNFTARILGGRTAKPYLFLTGGTQFNSELFAAENLLIEDESSSTDIRTRRAFGAAIKGLVANQSHLCHGKGREGISLTPFWRLTISLNCEPEHLAVLPPIDESLEDKIMLLRVVPPAEPFNDGSPEGREAFWDRLTSEIPAFMSFVLDWTIPPSCRSTRFGVAHYHHPDLIRALDDLAPETRLWTLIDAAILTGQQPWTGRAADLERILSTADDTSFEARRLFTWPTACGVYLARLERKRPGQVVAVRRNDERLWTLRKVTE